MANKRVTVITKSKTGRNQSFRDNRTQKIMSDVEFVARIHAGQYKNYHIRNINGRLTPVSNPDGKPGNNLG